MSVACSPGGRRLAAAALSLLLVAILVTVLAAVFAAPAGAQAAPSCTASPTEVTPGETVTLDASATENASSVEFDVDGDGTYERTDTTDFVVEVAYDQVGTYQPMARAIAESTNDPTPAVDCGSVTVARNQPPSASLVVEPETVAVGDTVTLDASNSSDPDGSIVQYRWDLDGNGSTDTVTDVSSLEHVYDEAGSYQVSVTVVDGDGATAAATVEVLVEATPPTAACTVEPTTVETGEPVTIDASDSADAEEVAFDVDGDGEFEETQTVTFQTTVRYDEPGTVQPRIVARNDAGEDRVTCGEVRVLAADSGGGSGGGSTGGSGGGTTNGSDGGSTGSGSGTADNGSSDGSTVSPVAGGSGGSGDGGVLGALTSALGSARDGPGSPLHAGGTLALLGGVGWLLGRVQRTKDDPRPRGVFEWRSDLEERFAAGRLETASGDSTAVDLEFEPDLVLLATVPRRTGDGSEGSSTDATTRLSNGIALRSAGGVVQHAVGVRWADRPIGGSTGQSPDATDRTAATGGQPTTKTANGAVVALPDGPKVREARVVATDADGFEIEWDAELDATILYRAVRLPADVEVTVGTTRVSAGTESVSLPDEPSFDALLLDAVCDPDATSPATADGAWSVGTACRGGREQSVTFGYSGDGGAATEQALALGRDGSRARLEADSESPTLAYERPAEADHLLQFASLSGVPALAPATGVVEVAPGQEPLAVDVGFEPTFVEYWIARPGGSHEGVSVGAALAGPDEVEQFGIDGRGQEQGGERVCVGELSEDGFELSGPNDGADDAGPATVAYRAWPGALGRRTTPEDEDGGDDA